MPVLQLLLRGSERVCADWSVAHAQYVAESESMDLRCSGAISSCHEDTWGLTCHVETLAGVVSQAATTGV